MTPALETPIKAHSNYAKTAIFGALILLCYVPAIRSLIGDWMSNEDMGHGFFVPLIAGYLLWQDRAELASTPVKPAWGGLALVLWGAAQSILGTLGAEVFLSRSAMGVTIIGAVWTVGGTEMLKKAAFPLFLLCFMIPIP